MCVPLPHEQDTNSADTAYEIVCLRIIDFCTKPFPGAARCDEHQRAAMPLSVIECCGADRARADVHFSSRGTAPCNAMTATDVAVPCCNAGAFGSRRRLVLFNGHGSLVDPHRPDPEHQPV